MLTESCMVIGGCRSGKSRYAQEYAEGISPDRRIFIATCVPYDDEMRDRVARHRRQRDSSWTTVETPLQLPEAIAEYSRKAAVVLADCLTLWITNLLMESAEKPSIEDHIERLAGAVQFAGCPVILVSNEVGTGIVPENKLARQFRDMVGLANQRLAACTDKVVWMVAGIPVRIKG
jgi:adenosylcobinamide kinase / adenosylcobinamide-phosphate guanylyltransferase